MGLFVVMMNKHSKKHLKLSVLLICILVDDVFKPTLQKRLCIHKFTLLSLIALSLFAFAAGIVTASGLLFISEKQQQFSLSLGKMYFWDQDPVLVLLQMYSTRLNGPWSANETKQVCVFVAAFCVLRNVCGRHWWLSLYLEI